MLLIKTTCANDDVATCVLLVVHAPSLPGHGLLAKNAARPLCVAPIPVVAWVDRSAIRQGDDEAVLAFIARSVQSRLFYDDMVWVEASCIVAEMRHLQL